MRRLFICFLLCLVPLRLWAGAWMPMAEGALHHAASMTKLSSPQPIDNHAAHDALQNCHGVMSLSTHEAHAQPEAHADTSVQKTDCHDATCQLCGVCHQSVSLSAWPLLVLGLQAHPLPVGASLAHVARSSPPLIKPPIS